MGRHRGKRPHLSMTQAVSNRRAEVKQVKRRLTDTLENLGSSQKDFWGRCAEIVCALLNGSSTRSLESGGQELNVGSLVIGNLGEPLSDPRWAVHSMSNGQYMRRRWTCAKALTSWRC